MRGCPNMLSAGPGANSCNSFQHDLQEICKSGAGLLENYASGKLWAGGKVAGLQMR